MKVTWSWQQRGKRRLKVGSKRNSYFSTRLTPLSWRLSLLSLVISVRGQGVISSTRTTSTVLDLLVIFIDSYSLIVGPHYKPVFSCLFILRPSYNIGTLWNHTRLYGTNIEVCSTLPDYMGSILRFRDASLDSKGCTWKGGFPWSQGMHRVNLRAKGCISRGKFPANQGILQ